MVDNALIDSLTARMVLYKVFQSIVGTDPCDSNLAVLFDPVMEEAYRVCVPADRTEKWQELARYSQAFDADRASFLDVLRDEYTRLFLGPGKLIAPPWESSYSGGSRQLFQESTLEARKMYVENGVLPSEYRKVADDHIALELGFLAVLGERLLEEVGYGSEKGDLACLSTSAAFLTEHLLSWIPSYARDMAKAQGSGFYQAVINSLLSFAQSDQAFLESLMAPAETETSGETAELAVFGRN